MQWQQIQDKNARDKLNGDWRDGIFLGVIWKTTEYLIGLQKESSNAELSERRSPRMPATPIASITSTSATATMYLEVLSLKVPELDSPILKILLQLDRRRFGRVSNSHQEEYT